MDTATFDGIYKVAQLGGTGVLLLLLNQLWVEFKAQNSFIRDLLLQAQKDREALAAAVGAELPREKA